MKKHILSLCISFACTFPTISHADRSIDDIEQRLQSPNYNFSFSGNVVSRDLSDGRKRELLENFSYTDLYGETWTARKGLKWDGATVPPIVWSFGLSPFVGKYRDAAVIHDQYCEDESRSDYDTHLVFYEAMRARGTPRKKATIMYWAVELFGPDWSTIVVDDTNSIYGIVGTDSNASSLSVQKVKCDSNYDNDALKGILDRAFKDEISEDVAKEQMKVLAEGANRDCRYETVARLPTQTFFESGITDVQP